MFVCWCSSASQLVTLDRCLQQNGGRYNCDVATAHPLFYWKTQGALRCARSFYRSTMKSYSQCQAKTESQYMETGSLLCTHVHYLSLWGGQFDCLIWRCELGTAFFTDLIMCTPLATLHCNMMVFLLLIVGHRSGPYTHPVRRLPLLIGKKSMEFVVKQTSIYFSSCLQHLLSSS